MPDQPVDPSQPEPHPSGMEGRVSRLETFVEAMRGDIADIRQQLRELRAGQSALGTELRNGMSALRTEMHSELSAIRGEMATMFRWIVGLLFTLLLAMMGGFAAVYTQIATILARLPK